MMVWMEHLTKNTPEQLKAFAARIDSYFIGQRAKIATRDLQRYFLSEDETFTGRHFERFADNDHPNRITERDLIAIEMLSVTLPPRAAIWVLGQGQARISVELDNLPANVDLWEHPDLMRPGGPMINLWRLLSRDANWPEGRSGGNDVGKAKTSKLIAAKRPRLAPILDSVVCDALGPVKDRWEAFAHAMADPERRDRIERALPDGIEIGVLRAVDVVVWMAGRHRCSGDPSPVRTQ